MSSEQSKRVKTILLKISEEIVDLSEHIEVAEIENDERAMHASKNRLRAIGDDLVDYLKMTTDDDLTFTRFMMGSVCSMLGYWNQAEISYREALSRWPDHIGILNELFDVLVAQKKYQEAEMIIRKSLKLGGETPEILRNHAAVLVHMKKINDARLLMINCIAKFPDDHESRNFLRKLESTGSA